MNRTHFEDVKWKGMQNFNTKSDPFNIERNEKIVLIFLSFAKVESIRIFYVL